MKIKILTLFIILFILNINIYAQSNHNDKNYKKYEEAYKKYEKDWNEKSRNDALIYINKYIKNYPKDAEAYFNRSALVNDEKKALADLNKAIELDARNPEYYIRRGIMYLSDYNFRNVEQGKKDYEQAIKLKPNYAYVYLKIGEWSFLLRDNEYIINLVTKGIESMPYNDSLYLLRGTTYLSNAKFDLAILDFNKAIEYNPVYIEAYFKRYIAFFKLKDFESALKDINKIMEFDNTAWEYQERAEIYEAMYNYEMAIADINKSIEMIYGLKDEDADYIEAQIGEGRRQRAEVYILMGEFELAIDDYTKNIDKQTDFLQTEDLVGRSNAYRLSGNLELAMKDVNAISDQNMEFGHSMTYYYRGLICIDKKEFDKALKDFNMGLELYKKESNGAIDKSYLFYWGRGKTYHLQGNSIKALEDYNKCISSYEIYKDSIMSVSNYREISNVYYSRGTLYFETEKYNEALKDLDQAILLYAVDADYYVNRGNIYYKLGNNDKAKADWQKAVELNPELKNELEEYLK